MIMAIPIQRLNSYIQMDEKLYMMEKHVNLYVMMIMLAHITMSILQ